MGFSLSKQNRKKPTPAHIDKRFKAISGLCMLLVTGVNSAPGNVISIETASAASWFLGLLSPGLLYLKDFFYVDTEETEVPIEKVEVLDVKNEDEKP